jgi:hypothetical protein
MAPGNLVALRNPVEINLWLHLAIILPYCLFNYKRMKGWTIELSVKSSKESTEPVSLGIKWLKWVEYTVK